MTSFTPTENRVLILPDERVEKKGMLFVPDTAQDAPITGTIVALGPGSEDFPQNSFLSIGQRVMFAKYGGNDVKVNDVNHIVLRCGEVLGVLEENA
jgi:chaperonin GroES